LDVGERKERVRQRLWLSLIAIPLTSCIPVEDFGTYWDKAVPDTRLEGNWKRVAARPDRDRKHGYLE
jgi:hypothetical protein